MRRAFWLFGSLSIIASASMNAAAADAPGAAAKAPATKAKAAGNAPGGAAGPAARPATAKDSHPQSGAVSDPRPTSLFRSAQNLEKTGKKSGAIGMYRDLLIRFPTSHEAEPAKERLKALGGKVPGPSEIKPAPPPEEAKFTRAPKPRYASQEANRAAVNQAIGGMINSAASQPAGGGGGGYPARSPY